MNVRQTDTKLIMQAMAMSIFVLHVIYRLSPKKLQSDFEHQ